MALRVCRGGVRRLCSVLHSQTAGGSAGGPVGEGRCRRLGSHDGKKEAHCRHRPRLHLPLLRRILHHPQPGARPRVRHLSRPAAAAHRASGCPGTVQLSQRLGGQQGASQDGGLSAVGPGGDERGLRRRHHRSRAEVPVQLAGCHALQGEAHPPDPVGLRVPRPARDRLPRPLRPGCGMLRPAC